VARLVVAAILVLAAVAVARLIQRRRTPASPTQPAWSVPVQLDRSEFAGPERPWLVVVFSSATCRSCADMVGKANALASPNVAVEDVGASSDPERHRRYHIEAVPITVLADAKGVVRASFVGPVSATDLWAAVAEVRQPGSTPRAQCTHDDPAGPDDY
jgi:hypothetical protein